MIRSFLVPLVLILATVGLFGLGYYAAPKPTDRQFAPRAEVEPANAKGNDAMSCCSLGGSVSICGEPGATAGVFANLGAVGLEEFASSTLDGPEPCTTFEAWAPRATPASTLLRSAVLASDNERCCVLNPFQTVCVRRDDIGAENREFITYTSERPNAASDLPECRPSGQEQ